MANIHFLQGDFKETIKAMKKAIAISGKAIYYTNLALLYRRTGQLEEAIRTNIKAIEVGANKAAVYNNLGVIYEDQKDFKKAADAYRTAIKLDPNLEEAHQNLIMLLKTKNSQTDFSSEH